MDTEPLIAFSPMKVPARIDTTSSRDAASTTTVEPPERGHAYPWEPSAAPSSRDEGEPRSRGYQSTGRPPIVDPGGNARSYFLGAGRETSHPGPEWKWT